MAKKVIVKKNKKKSVEIKMFERKENEYFMTKPKIDELKELYTNKYNGKIVNYRNFTICYGKDVRTMIVDKSRASGTIASGKMELTFFTQFFDEMPSKIKNFIGLTE